MYQVEFAVDWASIGVDPKPGMEFKADLCVNDNDTLVDFRLLPEGPVRLLKFSSLGGATDFGFPDRWITIRLAGPTPLRKWLLNLYSSAWILVSITAALVFLSVFLMHRRILRLLNAGRRQPPENTDLAKKEGVAAYPVGIDSDQPVIAQARAYITHHISEPLRPDQLANGMGVSLRNLERIFKGAMNTTPNAFIVTIRLEYAAGLLAGDRHTIAEVADAAGFNDPAYFSRVFKKHFGQTPREYHNHQRKISSN